MQVVEVDGVGSQSTQGILAIGSNAVGVGIQPNTVVAAHDPELCRDLNLLTRHATARHGPPNQFFVVSLPVTHSGVEHGDSRVESCMNSSNGFGIVNGSVPLGKSHASEAKG